MESTRDCTWEKPIKASNPHWLTFLLKMSIPLVTNDLAKTVDAKVYFLKHNDKFKFEKPYAFKFAGLCHNGPPTNAEFDYRVVSVTDMRGNEQSFSLETNGFSILHVENHMTYDDYPNPVGQHQYFRQLEELLKTQLSASRVKVFRHGPRKRDPLFGAGYTDQPFENDQPTTLAHVGIKNKTNLLEYLVIQSADATLKECYREIGIQEGEKASEVYQNRFQWINVWKPLKGPMNDWPLAVCDASSVESADIQASDLIYPDHVAENALLCHNSNQRWFYLSNHLQSEAIVFMQSDSLGANRAVPHCSFANPHAAIDEDPRESIEARLLVYYDQ